MKPVAAAAETFCLTTARTGRPACSHMQGSLSLPLAAWKVVIIQHSLPWWASLCLVLYNYWCCVSWGGLRHRQDDSTSKHYISLLWWKITAVYSEQQAGRQSSLSDDTAHQRRMWAGFPTHRTIYRQPMSRRARPAAKPSQNSFILGRLVRGLRFCLQRKTRTSQLGSHIPLWLEDWLLISDY